MVLADPPPVDGASRAPSSPTSRASKATSRRSASAGASIRKLGIKPIVAADTAGSARDVSERGDKTVAAIASRLAAEIYGLDILAEDIEDEAHNTTPLRGAGAQAETGRAQGLGTRWSPPSSSGCATCPAALYKAMGGFATNGVNMTKLESYMVDGNFLATQFYADVDGPPRRPRGSPLRWRN